MGESGRCALLMGVGLCALALFWACAERAKPQAPNGGGLTDSTGTRGPVVRLRGQEVQLVAPLPRVGEEAPEAVLTAGDLQDVALSAYRGKTVVLNIFPSVDTPTCSASVREFNRLAAGLENVQVLCISQDLPFALGRFCAAEGIANVVALSAFRSDFARRYGVEIASGVLRGLCARAVMVILPSGRVGYVSLVGELGEEPNYEGVLCYLAQ